MNRPTSVTVFGILNIVFGVFEPFPFDQADGVRPFTESGNPYQSP
jgi:hypothetical protein